MRKQVLRFPPITEMVPRFKIKRGFRPGSFYAVFEDGWYAEQMEWLFKDCRVASFGQFENSYELKEGM